MTNADNRNFIAKLIRVLDIENLPSNSFISHIRNLNVISTFLKFQNIKNLIVELNIDKSTELLFPFITQKKNSEEFHIVLSSFENNLLIYDPADSSETYIAKDSFNDKYKSVLLFLEIQKTKFIHQKEKRSKDYIHWFGLFIIILLGLLSSFIQHKYWIGTLCFVNGLGVAFALSYTNNELGIRNTVFD